MWPDETHFKLSGAINRHNCVCHSRANPHVMIEGQLNQLGITVQACLSCKGLLGPIFSIRLLHNDLSLTMLRDTVLPQLQRQHGNDGLSFQWGAIPNYTVNSVWVSWWTITQQVDKSMRADGMATTVTRPHPVDFFRCVVEDQVFSEKPHMLGDRIHCLRESCQEIDGNKELCAKVCLSIASRLQECVNNAGRQFEHLRLYLSALSFELIKLCDNHNLHVIFHRTNCKPTFAQPCITR